MKTQRFLPKIDPAKALAMYDAGASDSAIAKACGVTTSGICCWRRRHRLRRAASNDNRLTPTQIRQAKNMLRNGATKAQIAAHLGISVDPIRKLRREMDEQGLRSTGIGGASIRKAVISDPDLPKRIEKAIGFHVPRDIRMDAVNEMYLELLDGKLSLNQVESSAARFRSRAFAMVGYNYSSRSLNEANDNDFSLAETVADPCSMDPFDEVLSRVFPDLD